MSLSFAAPKYAPLQPATTKLRRGAVLILCCLAAGVEGFDLQALAAGGYLILRDTGLAIGKAELGWIISTTYIGLMIGAGLGGGLADRFGAKRLLVWSVTMFGLITLAMVVVDGFWSLIAVRFVSGLGFGAVLPVAMMTALQVTPPSRKATITTLIYCSMTVGGMASAWLLTALGAAASWRTPFVYGGVAALCLAAAALVTIPPAPPAAPRTADESETGRIQAMFGEGRAIQTAMLWLIFVPCYFISGAFLGWLPIMMIGKGMDGTTGPLALVWYGVGGLLGSLAISRLIDRFGFAVPMLLAHAALIVCLVLLALSHNPWFLYFLSAVAGICVLGIVFPLLSVVTLIYPLHARGTALGATIAIGRLGSVLGPLVPGLLFSMNVGVNELLWGLCPLALLSTVALWILSGRVGEKAYQRAMPA